MLPNQCSWYGTTDTYYVYDSTLTIETPYYDDNSGSGGSSIAITNGNDDYVCLVGVRLWHGLLQGYLLFRSFQFTLFLVGYWKYCTK